MDLELYLRVVRRHRWLVLLGLAVTFALAMLSYVRVSPSGIGYRSSPVWSNSTRLILTQPGFPEYRSVLLRGDRRRAYWAIAGLSDVYAAYVTSDEVVTALKKQRLIDVKTDRLPIAAVAVKSTVTSGSTPLIEITAQATSPTKATRLTGATARALIALVARRQSASEIPKDERINVLIVQRPGAPTLVAPRSKTPLFAVLFAGLTITFAAQAARGRSNSARAPA